MTEFGSANGKRIGDMRAVRKGLAAASLFDLEITLREATLEHCKHLVDELCIFGFEELTGAHRSAMKDGLEGMLAYAKGPFDWSGLDGASDYDDEHKKGPDHWRSDPAEKARRNWQRWRDVMHPSCRFPAFRLALRLVALVQPSSAFVERCFSQMKHIVETCGSKMLSDLLLLRMLFRCNRKAYAEFGIAM